MLRGLTGSIADSRACISRAALLVKVTARMPCGPTWPVDSSQAIRVVSTRVFPAARTGKNERAVAAGSPRRVAAD